MKLAACLLLAACGSAPKPWPVPDGWKHERIPFPLDFAPSLSHKGVEELRFAPGFFDPKAAGYWSYAFVWRLEGSPTFDANTVAGELTTYFRGLVEAVDEKHEIADRNSIVAHAEPRGASLALTAHMIDPFTTKQPVELTGAARRLACSNGSVWVFVIAPVQSPIRADLDALATQATCDQPSLANSR